jgi:hypothetical protein
MRRSVGASPSIRAGIKGQTGRNPGESTGRNDTWGDSFISPELSVGMIDHHSSTPTTKDPNDLPL